MKLQSVTHNYQNYTHIICHVFFIFYMHQHSFFSYLMVFGINDQNYLDMNVQMIRDIIKDPKVIVNFLPVYFMYKGNIQRNYSILNEPDLLVGSESGPSTNDNNELLIQTSGISEKKFG